MLNIALQQSAREAMMQTQASERFNELSNSFQEFTNLTIKTLQNFHYIKPEEWNQLQNPEHIFEKQLHVCVENGHNLLDYFEKSFLLLERNWMKNAKNMKKNAERVINKTQDSAHKFKNNQ
jgi:hypothetical protein